MWKFGEPNIFIPMGNLLENPNAYHLDNTEKKFIYHKICNSPTEKDDDLQESLRNLRAFLNIPSHFEVLLFNDSLFSEAGFLGLIKIPSNSTIAFIDSGGRSAKAIAAANLHHEIEIVGSSKDSAYAYVPKAEWLPYHASVLHLTSTNLLEGSQARITSGENIPVIADCSDDLFTGRINVESFNLIYAEGNGNILPAGITLVIFKKVIFETGNVCFDRVLAFKDLKNITAFKRSLSCLSKDTDITSIRSHHHQNAGMLYREIERNTRLLAIVNPVDRSEIAVRFNVRQMECYSAFFQLLRIDFPHLWTWNDYGDFVIFLERCSRHDVINLIAAMQRFEFDSLKG